jgi:uncharacterized iron-regulated membrane protein
VLFLPTIVLAVAGYTTGAIIAGVVAGLYERLRRWQHETADPLFVLQGRIRKVSEDDSSAILKVDAF